MVVGKDSDLFSRELQARRPTWLVPSPPRAGDRFEVKIRSAHPGAWATLTSMEDSLIRRQFDELQRGICPGQFAVLYDADRVVGSAELDTPETRER